MFLSSVSTPIPPPHLLDQRLGALAHGVGGGLVEDREAHPVLGADAVRSAHPAGFVQQLVGSGDVLGLAPVVGGGSVGGRRRQDVAGHPACLAVAGLHQDVAVDGQGQRATHRRVGEEGVRVLAALVGGPLVAQRRIGIGELHDQPLHQGAEGRHHPALAPPSPWRQGSRAPPGGSRRSRTRRFPAPPGPPTRRRRRPSPGPKRRPAGPGCGSARSSRSAPRRWAGTPSP